MRHIGYRTVSLDGNALRIDRRRASRHGPAAVLVMAGAQLAERAGLAGQAQVHLVLAAERAGLVGRVEDQLPAEPIEQVEQGRVVLARAETVQMVGFEMEEPDWG